MQLFNLCHKDQLEVFEGIENRVAIFKFEEIALDRGDLERLLIESLLFEKILHNLLLTALLLLILLTVAILK